MDGATLRAVAVALTLAAGGPVSGGSTLSAQDANAGFRPDTTLTIRTSGSALEFTPSRIAVKQGTRLRIRYVNAGTLPHNLVLVWDANDIDMLGMAAYDASATGYVPRQYEDRMIAFSPLAVPGDTVEIDLVVPDAGEYLFVCLYAGHYNMMIGTLRSMR